MEKKGQNTCALSDGIAEIMENGCVNMGFADMYVRWVDKYVELIDGAMAKSHFRLLTPFLMVAKTKLIRSKVRA